MLRLLNYWHKVLIGKDYLLALSCSVGLLLPAFSLVDKSCRDA